MFDLLIRGGTVVDGTGAPAFRADVAVADGKIAAVAPGLDAPARRLIDASDRLVTPGFIDIHRHADVSLFTPSFGEAELRQGLTTIVNGNCGLSAVPLPAARREEILRFLQPVIGECPPDVQFETFSEYMELAGRAKLPLNAGMLIGNGTVRAAVKGYASGRLTPDELRRVHACLRGALEAGALGVSLGIVYAPEYNYDADGFVEALAPMRDFHVPLIIHIRGEGDHLHESLREVIGIARRLGVPLHISHFKCIGKRNWGHGTIRALELLDEARRSGMRVDCDVYPYTAGSTQLIQILPPDWLEGGVPAMVRRLRDPAGRERLREILSKPGEDFENLVDEVGWENIRCTTFTRPRNLAYAGKSVAEIAALRGQDPLDCVCDLLAEESCKISMVDFITSEEDVRRVLRCPHSSVISDSVYPTGGLAHPRLYAAFPKVLIEYVRERRVLTLEQAVHKMSGGPAGVLNLSGKGLLKAGRDADLNVFALENLASGATYEDPRQPARGFDHVIVGGETAVDHDEVVRRTGGRLLRRV